MSVRTLPDRSELGAFGLARVDVVEGVGEVTFPDPYRMLEDETREVRAWVASQHARAGEALAALPGLATLRDELAAHLLADRLLTPLRAGGRWLWPERDVAGHVRAVRASTTLEEGPGQRLVAAADVPVDGDEAIDWLVPSPDGRLLALGVSSHGDEQPVLALLDIASRELLGAPTAHVGSVAWLPDASGLYLARGRARSQEQPLRRLAFLRPGGRASWVEAPPLATDGVLLVQVSADGRYVGLVASAVHPRLLAVHDRLDGSWAEGPSADDEEIFCGTFVRDEYYAVTDRGASRGRLVAAPAGTPALRWREVLPETDAVLRTVAPFGEDLLVSELVDSTPRLRVVSTEGQTRATVPLPPEHTISSFDRFRAETAAKLPAQVDGRALVFTASSVRRSTTLWRYDVERDALEELTRPGRELPQLTTETLTCRARDGHEVRCVLVRRADRAAAGVPQPTLLHGYGGFNSAPLPGGYPGLFAPWVTAGGTFAFAHLRGDGTFGTGQWRDGRREHKQHSFDDLIACAEELIARKLTAAAQLAVCGASNGGLLTSAVIVQRPELFRAAAVLVPMCDMSRLGRERFSEVFQREYGDPRIEAEARWLRAYSPLHGIRAGVRYPATIIVAGDRDMRTHAWHARKLAAALLDHAHPDTQVLLRTHLDRGHSSTVASEPQTIAEWLGFLMAHVGLGSTSAR